MTTIVCIIYRPISLTCFLCIVIKRLTKDQILFLLHDNQVLNSSQDVFLYDLSCMTKLVPFGETLTDAYDNDAITEAIFLDIYKAFGKPFHS